MAVEISKLAEVFAPFNINGDFVNAMPYGNGHINDTYAVQCSQGGTTVKYILQRINHNIFKNPPELMDNIVRVTEHLAGQFDGMPDKSRRVLTVIRTREGMPYLVKDGYYWRAYIFIENARTYDVPEKLEQIRAAGKAFGEFQKGLVTLGGKKLFETIPGFHDGLARYAAFESALTADVCGRADGARAEIEFVKSHKHIFDKMAAMVKSGELPTRVTHNDTKINNVMIDDATGEGICVIDLDTVMPGSSLYDFGDLVRTTSAMTAEDERDVSKIKAYPERFEALVKGYLEGAGEFLTGLERGNLVLAGQFITLIIGTRFLTDYLAGDKYFKIHRPGHNLDRCRTQLKLVESLTVQAADFKKLIDSCQGV